MENSIDATKPIVPQLKKFAEENQLDLGKNIGWKVELSKRVKQKFAGELDEGVEDQWVKLFEALQSA